MLSGKRLYHLRILIIKALFFNWAFLVIKPINKAKELQLDKKPKNYICSQAL